MGVPIEATVEHNVTRSIYFPDPDGNRVELYCDMVDNGFEAMRTGRLRGAIALKLPTSGRRAYSRACSDSAVPAQP